MLKVGLSQAGVAFALLAAAAPGARADLYRWVDPETGSVKFSNFPPSGDRPAVIVPFRGASPVPERTPAIKADGQEPLEERRRFLQQAMLQTGLDSANRAALERQVQAYQAVSKELDRLDPGGAGRRRNEDVALFEKMRAGLAAPADLADDPTKGPQ